MNNPVWILIIVIGCVALLIKLITTLAMNSAKQRLIPLANSMGGTVVAGIFQGVYLRQYINGMEVRISTLVDHGTETGYSSPSYLQLKIMRPLGFYLHIMKEDVFSTKLGKAAAGFDLKIGDPVFDKDYFIRAHDKNKVKKYLQHPDKRAADLPLLFVP
jgi:hypothetical protein